MRRRGPRKHSLDKLQSALEMIRKGENPFRASKNAGIARTTLLYHLEKLPSDAFPNGVNPIVEHIRQKIEMLLWKTRLRLIQNMWHKSRKTDEKTSAVIWKYLNESPIPAIGMGQVRRAVMDSATVEDKLTYREFILERKQEKKAGSEGSSESLGAASPDTPQAAAPAPEAGGPTPAEGA